MPYDRASANRAFGYAVLASLLLHALLLLLDWPQLRQAFQRPADLLAPIVARLIQPPAPPATAPQPAPPRSEAAKSEPAKSAPPKEAPPKEASLESEAPQPEAPPRADAQAPAAPRPGPILERAPAAAAPVAPSAPSASVAKASPAPAAPAAAVSEASMLAHYRAALIGEARRYKRYPPVALDNGWEGEVVVRMVIGADGALAALSVQSSSGHSVLDRQALEMFRKAKPLVPVPQALRGRQFALELRAVFNLMDQGSG